MTLSIKLCITAKPRPERSSGLPVVNSGSIAFAISGMPTPLSVMVIRTSRPGIDGRCHCDGADLVRVGVDDAVGHGLGHSGFHIGQLGHGGVIPHKKRRQRRAGVALVALRESNWIFGVFSAFMFIPPSVLHPCRG